MFSPLLVAIINTFKELKSLTLFKKPCPGGSPLVPHGHQSNVERRKVETVQRLQQPSCPAPVYGWRRCAEVPHPIPFVRPPCVCPKPPGLFRRLLGDPLRLANVAILAMAFKMTYDMGVWSDPEYTMKISMKAQQKFFTICPSDKDEPFSIERMMHNTVNAWNSGIKTVFYYLIQAPLNYLHNVDTTVVMIEEKITEKDNCPKEENE